MKRMTLKQARERHTPKMTQRELSRRADVDISVISKIECGVVTNPEFNTVEKLAKALNVDIGRLRFDVQDSVSA
jgi:transcriptional regulator with XRE-family HTH domain